MSTDPGLGRSTGVMAAGTAVSRVLGLIRNGVLAVAIGLNTVVGDQFALANTLPNILYMLVAGGVVNAVLVPQIVRAYRGGRGQEYADRLLTVAIAILLAITVLATASAPLLIRVVGGAQDPAAVHLATVFAWWCIPQVFFYGLYTLLGQVLNARGSFGPYMWAPVANNLVSILGFVVFIAVFGRGLGDGDLADPAAWTIGPVLLVAGSATLGIVTQALVLIWPLHRIGFRFRPRRDWRGAGLSTAGRVAGWTFAALLAGQAGVLVVTRIANSAGAAGDLAIAGNNAYNYAFLVFMLPHSLVTVSLLTALFTRMSGHAAAEDATAVRDDVDTGLRLIGAFTIIAAAVVAVLALPVARIIAPGNAPVESASLAPIIVALTLGLPALGIWSLVQRVHYAYEDARGLFSIQVAMAAVVAAGTVVGRFTLPRSSWVTAAGAAIALSYLMGAVWGGVKVHRRIGAMGSRATVVVGLKAAASMALATAIGWPLSRLFGDLSAAGFFTAIGVCLLVGTVMAASYGFLLHLLGVRELQRALAPVISVLRRTMGPLTDRRDDSLGVSVHVTVGQGTLLAGRYRLDHPAPCDLPGTECWVASDQILDRPVRALLLLEGRVKQAQDAARRAALVSDPRLLRVLDVGDHEGLAYVVTERLPGRDLAQLTAHGALPADQARAIIGEAAVALEVARRRGVHHLALRPSAVHVTAKGGVVVSGLALDGELGEHGLGDARSTTRADTVGLVALLYLALTGRWPAAEGATTHGVPPAPLLAGRPVPPAELGAGIPNDLDTLCAVTLGPNDDGPHSPAELVRELEPWGAVTTVEPPRGGMTEGRASAVSAVSAVPAAVPAEPPVAPEPTPTAEEAPTEDVPTPDQAITDQAITDETITDETITDETITEGFEPEDVAAGGRASAVETAAATPVRSSVFGKEPTIQHRPGTPPPAIPPAARRPDPRVVAAAPAPRTISMPATDQPGTTGHLPTPVASSVATEDHHTFDDLIGRSTNLLVRRTFNPTPFVLLLVGGAIVIGIIWAWNSLTSPAPPLSDLFGNEDGTGGLASPIDPTESAEPTGESTEPTETEPTPVSAPPVIASAEQVDPPPTGDNNEHPELVDDAIDGDTSTMWISRTYKSPTYGMKPGIGYAVQLEEEATVTEVVLITSVTGGMVEVRATSADEPTEGPVLASGPMSDKTTLTFDEPVSADSIVLWFTELPRTTDGRNRVELIEVLVR